MILAWPDAQGIFRHGSGVSTGHWQVQTHCVQVTMLLSVSVSSKGAGFWAHLAPAREQSSAYLTY